MNLRSILLEANEFEDGSCDKVARVGIRVAQAELDAEANPLASALARTTPTAQSVGPDPALAGASVPRFCETITGYFGEHKVDEATNT